LGKAITLADEIREGEVYTRFIRARAAIKENPDAHYALECYNKLRASYGGKDELSFDQEKHLGNVYWELMLNETVKEYLQAEKNLFDFMKTFYALFGELFDIAVGEMI